MAQPTPRQETQLPEPDAAEALSLQNARLAALHEVTLGLTSTLELSEVLQRVAVMAQTLSASAHAHIYLYDPERDFLEPAASHWSSADRVIPLEPRRTGITYAVARTGQAEFIEDTALHLAYAGVPAELRPGAVACLPLAKGPRVMGTLSLGYWAPHRFDVAKREFLDLMARHAAIAIENARLIQVAVEKAHLEHDLEMARRIQAGLIPRETPCLPGWDFGAFWQPAELVGGDFYDFVEVNGPESQGLLIADVSEKGMPAALFMALARSTLRASLTSAGEPSECMARANRLLYADAANGMFVTVFYAQFDPVSGLLTYVNAGHNPPLLFRHATDQFHALSRTGMALAVDDTRPYGQCSLELDPGDFILFYTDGVTDALDCQQQAFGFERLRQVALTHRHAAAGRLIASLRRALGDHIGANHPFDDVTAVVVKRV